MLENGQLRARASVGAIYSRLSQQNEAREGERGRRRSRADDRLRKYISYELWPILFISVNVAHMKYSPMRWHTATQNARACSCSVCMCVCVWHEEQLIFPGTITTSERFYDAFETWHHQTKNRNASHQNLGRPTASACVLACVRYATYAQLQCLMWLRLSVALDVIRCPIIQRLSIIIAVLEEQNAKQSIDDSQRLVGRPVWIVIPILPVATCLHKLYR